jgi:hypothetical protein
MRARAVSDRPMLSFTTRPFARYGRDRPGRCFNFTTMFDHLHRPAIVVAPSVWPRTSLDRGEFAASLRVAPYVT